MQFIFKDMKQFWINIISNKFYISFYMQALNNIFLRLYVFRIGCATIAERTINVVQYNSKWAFSYANFSIEKINLLEMIVFKTQIIFNMVLFSLQKSTQKASNLIFHFYFTNFNQKALNSLRSNSRAFAVVSISEVTKFHIWLH